ncbi:hypothetical protein BCR44DRAFT_1325374 [Catenaria anguillulae PL171]|uniref:USP8 dimerisation domain-containing protein n=1 Tax=Catenaria anguillulae PL171 TaxID=765915 RepID=A0A1Y2HB19_9FUNG|nr:hypothetical protein BCR44DRAFT_1325374 [Catenaria anguillulae PL171]
MFLGDAYSQRNFTEATYFPFNPRHSSSHHQGHHSPPTMSSTADANATTDDPPMPVLSVAELTSRARTLGLNPNSDSIGVYLRAAQNTFLEAQAAHAEGTLGQAYELYYRFTLLVRNVLPAHPQYSRTTHAAIEGMLLSDCKVADTKMEMMRPVIEQRYRAYLRQSGSSRPTSSSSAAAAAAAAPDQPRAAEPAPAPLATLADLSSGSERSIPPIDRSTSNTPPPLPPKPAITPSLRKALVQVGKDPAAKPNPVQDGPSPPAALDRRKCHADH